MKAATPWISSPWRQGTKMPGTRGSGIGVRGPVPPKYRNPQNPEETWAGRGLRPKWLAAAIKGGKSADDFLIRGAVGSKKGSKPKREKGSQSPQVTLLSRPQTDCDFASMNA